MQSDGRLSDRVHKTICSTKALLGRKFSISIILIGVNHGEKAQIPCNMMIFLSVVTKSRITRTKAKSLNEASHSYRNRVPTTLPPVTFTLPGWGPRRITVLPQVSTSLDSLSTPLDHLHRSLVNPYHPLLNLLCFRPRTTTNRARTRGLLEVPQILCHQLPYPCKHHHLLSLSTVTRCLEGVRHLALCR